MGGAVGPWAVLPMAAAHCLHRGMCEYPPTRQDKETALVDWHTCLLQIEFTAWAISRTSTLEFSNGNPFACQDEDHAKQFIVERKNQLHPFFSKAKSSACMWTMMKKPTL